MRAACLIPPPPHYSRAEFVVGLAAAGLQLVERPVQTPTRDDVLVIWNRRRTDEHVAARYQHAGAQVIVVENGYLGADDKPPRYYAIAREHHLGAGAWHAGAADRWAAVGIELKPWRKDGEHILLLPQRSIGEHGVTMPEGWAERTAARLKGMTGRPIRVRKHPGKRPHPPLEPDLEGCHAVLTWASGAALKAIVAGVPAFHELLAWVGAPAAKRLWLDDLEQPFLGDRLPMLQRLAWAQWTAAEVKRGLPFRHLLGLA